jgi:hypothetical protein
LKIQVVPGADSDPEKLRFTWYLKETTLKALKFKLEFDQPKFVSYEKISEKITVEFVPDYAKLFPTKDGRLLENLA